ncbi:AMP-binding protein [Rosistilla oblonga]|uniref:AMP-binding protein n=1 Tax=Rosistilla oblonga TaxID=2527990 RepID=UPI003A968F4F
MSLIEQLLANAVEHPTALAWIDVLDHASTRSISWSDIGIQTLQAAERLAAWGISPGQHVAILCDNSRQLVVLLGALRLVGLYSDDDHPPRSAVDIVIDVRLPDSHVARLIDHCDARFVLIGSTHCDRSIPMPADCRAIAVDTICSPQHATAADAATLQLASDWAADLDPTQTEAIMYTSGTTADPKGVVLSHGNLASNAAGKLAAVPQQPDDRRLTLLPISHAYARTCDVGTWILSRSVLAADSGYQGLLRMAAAVRPTAMNLVPHLAEKIAHVARAAETPQQGLASLGLDRLRLLGCGGAAMPPGTFKDYSDWGITVIQGYGLTESSPVICSATPQDAAPGVVGRPVAGVQLKLDARGQILCRGTGLAKTYYKQDAAMAARMDDGWLQTGDLGRLDAEGRLQVLGRIDDLIVLSTGRKVMPAEIESRICQLPGITHAIVSGNGQPVLTAWIATESASLTEADAGRWREKIADRLSDLPTHAIPRVVRAIDVPLAVESGTLTAKGTVRRSVVMSQLEPV